MKAVVTQQEVSSHGVSCDEDIDAGKECGDGALAQQLHLHVNEEVTWAMRLPLQVHGSSKAVEPACAKVTFFVSSWNANDDAITRVGRRGANTEDLRRDDDVSLEAKLVIGDANWHVLALRAKAAYPLAASIKTWGRLIKRWTM